MAMPAANFSSDPRSASPLPLVPPMSLQAETKRYLVLALRTPRFSDAVVAPHVAFLEALRAEGKLEMTGGFSDRTGGAYVLNVASLEEAEALVAKDPLATSDASLLSVYEWNTR